MVPQKRRELGTKHRGRNHGLASLGSGVVTLAHRTTHQIHLIMAHTMTAAFTAPTHHRMADISAAMAVGMVVLMVVEEIIDRPIPLLGRFTHMKMLTHVGMRKIITGWAVFITGLLLLLWLHTFRDSAAHSAILPLLLLLWIVLAVAVWDGCKVVAPPLRLALLLLQAVGALSASTLFFKHLLRTLL
jgi:hypothetical protein